MARQIDRAVCCIGAVADVVPCRRNPILESLVHIVAGVPDRKILLPFDNVLRFGSGKRDDRGASGRGDESLGFGASPGTLEFPPECGDDLPAPTPDYAIELFRCLDLIGELCGPYQTTSCRPRKPRVRCHGIERLRRVNVLAECREETHGRLLFRIGNCTVAECNCREDRIRASACSLLLAPPMQRLRSFG